MSAFDLAKLAQHLIKVYPQYYHYFSVRSYTTYDQGKAITQPNRDTVLEKFEGADGLKTGYTDAAGYSITASAVRNGQRLIVVLGGLRYPDLDKDSDVKRDWIAEQRRGDEAARVLGIAFREFRQYKLFKPGDAVGNAPVWQGASDNVALTVAQPLAVTMQVDSRERMKLVLHYDGPVQAPIAKGQELGTLKITAPDFPGMNVPVYAAEAVPSAGLFARVMDGLHALVMGTQ